MILEHLHRQLSLLKVDNCLRWQVADRTFVTMWNSETQTVEQVPDDLKDFFASLQWCECSVGHPLLSALRFVPLSCDCENSFWTPLEAFAKRYNTCVVTGEKLTNEDGACESLHCIKSDLEIVIKTLFRRSDHLKTLTKLARKESTNRK